MNFSSVTNSWTFDFYRKWQPFLTLPSLVRLRNLVIRERSKKALPDATIRLQLLRPFRTLLELRELGTDVDTLEEILTEGVYASIAKQIHDCRTIVDLGANVGLATLYLAGSYPESRVVSVEPHPENFAFLSRNVSKLVSSGRCYPLQAAIWSSSGRTLSLSIPNPNGFSGVNVEENGAPLHLAASSITMPEVLDRYRMESLDLLKVDIEGAEVELFSGDISWLERVRAIAIEFHADSRTRSGFDAAVRRFGFKAVDSSKHTVLVSR
jgi:FkbM family methyltransferase